MFLTGSPCFNVSVPIPRLSLSSPWMWDAETLVNSEDSKWKHTQKHMSEEGYYTNASFHKVLNSVVLTSPSANRINIYNIDKKSTETVGFSLSSGVAVQQALTYKNSLFVMGDTELLVYKDILANEDLIAEGYVEATSSKVQTGRHARLLCDKQMTVTNYENPLKIMSLLDTIEEYECSTISTAFGNETKTFDIEKEEAINGMRIPYSSITSINWSNYGLYIGTEDGKVLLQDDRMPKDTCFGSITSSSSLLLWKSSQKCHISTITNSINLPYLVGIGNLNGDIDIIDMRYIKNTTNNRDACLSSIHGLGPINSIAFAEHHLQYMAITSCGDVSLMDLNDPIRPVYTIKGELGSNDIGVPKALATSMLHSPLTITTAFGDGSVLVHKVPDTVSSALCRRINNRIPRSSLRADRMFGMYDEEKDPELIDDMLSMFHSGKYDEALDIIIQKTLEYTLSGEIEKSERMISLIDMLDCPSEKQDEKVKSDHKRKYSSNKNKDEDKYDYDCNYDYDYLANLGIDIQKKHKNPKQDFQKLVCKYGTFDVTPYKVPEDVLLIRNTIKILNAGLVFLVRNSSLSSSFQVSSVLGSFTQSFVLPPSSTIMSPEDIVRTGIANLGLYFYKPSLLQGISLPSSPRSQTSITQRPYERLFSSLLLVVLHVLLVSVGDALNAMLRLRTLLQTWTGGFEKVLSPLPIILETLLMPSIFSQDSGFSLPQMVSIVSSILESDDRGKGGDFSASIPGDIAYFSDMISELETASGGENNNNNNDNSYGGDKNMNNNNNNNNSSSNQTSRLKAMTRWKSATADESSESYDSSSTTEATVNDNISDPLTQDISTPSSTLDENNESEANSLDMDFTLENSKDEENDNLFIINQPEAQYGTLTWCVRELFKEAGKAILTPFKGTGRGDEQSPTTIYKLLEEEAERIVSVRKKLDEEVSGAVAGGAGGGGGGETGLQQSMVQSQVSQFQQSFQGTMSMVSSQTLQNDERSTRRITKARMPMPGAGDSELYRIYWILSRLGTDMTIPPDHQPATEALLAQLRIMLDVAEGKSSVSTQSPVLVSAPLFLCAIGELLAAKDFLTLRKTLDAHFRMVLEARGLRYKYIDVEKSGPITAPFEQAVLEVCKTLVWPLLIRKLLTRAKGCAEACSSLELLLKYLGSIPTLLVLKDLPFLGDIPSLIQALGNQFVLLFKQARQGIGFGDVENVATLIRKVTQIHLVEEAGLVDALVEARDKIENLLNLKQKR